MSAALVESKVLTWGKAEECGHGMAAGSPPLLEPLALQLPAIRAVRCGMNHTLACSQAGDIFAWGGGTTHQLANRPRDVEDPHDAREEPDDELIPYLISSKALQSRFVLMADGGAQHSVMLAWDDEESMPDVAGTVEQEQSWEEATSTVLVPEEDDRPKE